MVIDQADGHVPGAGVKTNYEAIAATRAGGDGGLAWGSGDENINKEVLSRVILEVESLQPGGLRWGQLLVSQETCFEIQCIKIISIRTSIESSHCMGFSRKPIQIQHEETPNN